jgi:DUF1680 family protein
MKTIVFSFLVFLTLFSFHVSAQQYVLNQVPFNKVTINDEFWAPRLDTHAHTTLETCIAQTRDSTARIENFKVAAGLIEGEHQGIYFDDSDVYKAMEGIAYSLINNPNPGYEALMDEWISYIEKAQQPDGYINTFYTIMFPDKRWTDMEKHEMYCGGHMIEAAVAYEKATGKDAFLNVAIKFADHLDATFGPGKRHWVPGHQEIELALVKLYHATGEKRYLDLAHWLLEERGQGHGVGRIWSEFRGGAAYCQDDVPVSDISEIKGHAVRAMYLFAGMADVASEKNIPEYIDALKRVWDDVVYRNMYITGGIGSSGSNEGFSNDYDLPNKTAYCETCASIGMVLWNSRMNQLTKESKYADVMERSLYNGVLAGWSLAGDTFFYVNPLESDGDHHRKRWYGCACCPSNVSRFIPSIGSYIYLANDEEILVNLFIGSQTEIDVRDATVTLTQKTNYPWDGRIELTVEPQSPVDTPIKIRIPGWCKTFDLWMNGEQIKNPTLEHGYAVFENEWTTGDKIVLDLDMPVKVVAADPRVRANVGKRAIQCGPVVYCLEETDHPNLPWNDMSLEPDMNFTVDLETDIFGGANVITTMDDNAQLFFIPYFLWDNRDAGKMKVWIDYSEL